MNSDTLLYPARIAEPVAAVKKHDKNLTSFNHVAFMYV